MGSDAIKCHSFFRFLLCGVPPVNVDPLRTDTGGIASICDILNYSATRAARIL